MNFLSAVMPGLRELRVPFAVGSIWLTALAFVGRNWTEGLSELGVWRDITGAVEQAPPTISTAALLFATYVAGILLHGAASTAVDYAYQTWLDAWKEDPRRRRGAIARRLALFSPKASSFIESTVRDRLQEVSPVIADWAPRQLIRDELDLAGMRLSTQAPEQFHQYDRLRAEAEFRSAIALPVLVLGWAISLELTWLLGIGLAVLTALASVFLLAQGIGLYRQANELLTGAIYFGSSSTPLLNSLVDTAGVWLAGQDSDREDSDDLAWLFDFLVYRGLFVNDRLFVSKLRHPSKSDLLRAALTKVNQKTRREFENEIAGQGQGYRRYFEPDGTVRKVRRGTNTKP